jgi:hypothetical protein
LIVWIGCQFAGTPVFVASGNPQALGLGKQLFVCAGGVVVGGGVVGGTVVGGTVVAGGVVVGGTVGLGVAVAVGDGVGSGGQ